jgi:hypothetical protein
MIRKLVFLIFLLKLSFYSWAQSLDYIDHSFFSISYVNNSPVGNYSKRLSNDFVKNNSGGLEMGYFINPIYKKSTNNRVFVGALLGFANNRQLNFKVNPPTQDFYLAHNEFWANLGIRYKPQLFAKKYYSFYEAYAGPRFYNSKLMERFNEDQVTLVTNLASTTLNYGLNAGVGFKISKMSPRPTYLELSLGYQSANAVKMIDRDLAFFNNYNFIYENTVLRPQYLVVKLSLVSYQ